jgi:hypothetical protein
LRQPVVQLVCSEHVAKDNLARDVKGLVTAIQAQVEEPNLGDELVRIGMNEETDSEDHLALGSCDEMDTDESTTGGDSETNELETV